MLKKECKQITEGFTERFLLEAQSHSGLPIINDVSLYYVTVLSAILISDDLLDYVMSEFLNVYMRVTHNHYMRNKTWKSYDW